MRCLQRTKKTPHPSAFGCHLLPQEKAFLYAESKEKPRTRRCKHSAWMSTAPNRADARTHYQQRNGAHISLPPGGRWHAKRDGRSPRNFMFSLALSQRALPHPTWSGAPSWREPFRIIPPIEKHHQRRSLGGVCVFSDKVAEPTEKVFY